MGSVAVTQIQSHKAGLLFFYIEHFHRVEKKAI